MVFVKFFVSIWALQLLEFFFNTKLWVFLLPQTNLQFLPQLSYVSNFNWLLVTFTWTFFFSLDHSQPHEGVVAKIVLFFFFFFFFLVLYFCKIIRYLIVPNKITCLSIFFFPLHSFSYKIWTTHLTLHFHICQLFYILFKILNDNIILFYFCYYCYKSKRLEY